MFRHKGAIFRELIKNKLSYVQNVFQVLAALKFHLQLKDQNVKF